ncbi:MAG: hypothetical protein ACFFCS_17000 [Candidatus Hodarchaeota archaeon]
MIGYDERHKQHGEMMARIIADKINDGWCLLVPSDYDVLDCFLAGVFLEDEVSDEEIITIEAYAPTTVMPAFLMRKSLELQYWLDDIEVEDFDRIIFIRLTKNEDDDIEAMVECCRDLSPSEQIHPEIKKLLLMLQI